MLALRPGIRATVNVTSLIVIGTAIGAVIAGSVTWDVTSGHFLFALLLVADVALGGATAVLAAYLVGLRVSRYEGARHISGS